MPPIVAQVILLLHLALLPFARMQQLSVSPTSYDSDGSVFTAQWSGLPASPLVLAIYMPATHSDSEWNAWFDINGPGGTISFPLPYYRQDVQLRILSSIHDTTSIAASNTITASSDERIQHIRLALGPYTNSLLLTYTTRDNVSSSVTFAPSSDPSAAATVTPFQRITYSASQMCGPPATNESIGFKDPGFHHTVLLSNLSSSLQYTYTINLPSSPAAQRNGSFYGPVGADRQTQVQMLLFGDMGVWSPYNSRSYRLQKPAPDTVALMRSIAESTKLPLVILNIGDISYARGIAFLWDDFMASIEPLTRFTPMMVGVGNHDFDFTGQKFDPPWFNNTNDSFGECGIAYSARFCMPPNALCGLGEACDGETHPPLPPFYYSYSQGPVYVVVISTETNFTVGSKQWRWLDTLLSSVDRSETPFVIVSGHRPLYTSSLKEDKFGDGLIQHVQPLLVKHRVDVYLSGHVHAYERTCVLNGPGECALSTADGFVHIVAGMAGNDYQVSWANTNYVTKMFPWLGFRSFNFGIVSATANASTLTLQYVVDVEGTVHDTVIIPSKF